MLGSDLRKISNTTLAIIGNAEALGVNRDPAGAHGRLVREEGSTEANMTCAAGGTAAYDMHHANMTVAQAHRWCVGTARCAGFCAEATFSPDVCTGDGGNRACWEQHELEPLGCATPDICPRLTATPLRHATPRRTLLS